jgi:hypothetical protein
MASVLAALSNDYSMTDEFSVADWTRLNEYLNAHSDVDRTQQHESVAGAFALEYGKGLLDFATDLIPGIGQAKAGSELVTGETFRGEEVGTTGRVVAGLR